MALDDHAVFVLGQGAEGGLPYRTPQASLVDPEAGHVLVGRWEFELAD